MGGDAREHEHEHDHHHDHGHRHDGHAHDPEPRLVRFERDLLERNGRIAAANRRAALRDRVAILNLIGSPGAGKTALLESLVPRLGGGALVLEGDQATDLDARRIEAVGGRVLQIVTGTVCHLDASMIDRGLRELAPQRGSIVFVENVGNLVCPALFDLGELAKAVVISVTEGEDKPLKYPHVFRAARLVVVTKTDLAPHVGFDERAFRANVHEVAVPTVDILGTSARTGEGIDRLLGWIVRAAAQAPGAAHLEAAP